MPHRAGSLLEDPHPIPVAAGVCASVAGSRDRKQDVSWIFAEQGEFSGRVLLGCSAVGMLGASETLTAADLLELAYKHRRFLFTGEVDGGDLDHARR